MGYEDRSQCVPLNAISGTTNKSKLSSSSGSALWRIASARFRLLSTSPTAGANCKHAILILAELRLPVRVVWYVRQRRKSTVRIDSVCILTQR